SSRGTIDQMNALALNFVQSKNDAKFSERQTGAPGQVDECRVGAIHNIHIMVARYKIETAANIGMCWEKVENLSPFRPCTGIRNVSRHENSSERYLRLDR